MEGTEVAETPNPWGVPKSQPWGSVQGPAMPQAFEDVMSEELVKQLQGNDPTVPRVPVVHRYVFIKDFMP